METDAERDLRPLSEWDCSRLDHYPLSHAEAVLLPLLVSFCDERGERAFKSQLYDLAAAAGLSTKAYNKATQDLVDRGALQGGWYNHGTVSEPYLSGTYHLRRRPLVDELLRRAFLVKPPGARSRISPLAD
jgi:hypothetical protein